MALKRIELNSDIIAVFIANEESIETPGVGIDALAKDGLLNQLKIGTSLWIDASDSEPCMGTAGYATWRLRATAKRFHSGLPHKAINPVELVSDALIYIQSRFYSGIIRKVPVNLMLYHKISPIQRKRRNTNMKLDVR